MLIEAAFPRSEGRSDEINIILKFSAIYKLASCLQFYADAS